MVNSQPGFGSSCIHLCNGGDPERKVLLAMKGTQPSLLRSFFASAVTFLWLSSTSGPTYYVTPLLEASKLSDTVCVTEHERANGRVKPRRQ